MARLLWRTECVFPLSVPVCFIVDAAARQGSGIAAAEGEGLLCRAFRRAGGEDGQALREAACAALLVSPVRGVYSAVVRKDMEAS